MNIIILKKGYIFMLNLIWCSMLLIGIIYGIISGNGSNVSNGIIDSATQAIELCITMAGVMGMWCGVMKIAEKSGLLDSITKKIQPMLKILFKDIPKGNPAWDYISLNIVANLLGLGWAATPAGLNAMGELGKINNYKENATDDMCTFLVINISSLQLIPVNIIAYRSSYGSVNPAKITGPAILATLISSVTAIIFCIIIRRVRKK